MIHRSRWARISSRKRRTFCAPLLVICVFLLAPQLAQAATFYVLPQSQEVWQGDTFVVEVRVSTEGQESVAVQGQVTFDPEILDVVDGRTTFEGAELRNEDLLARILFLAKAPGTARVAFQRRSPDGPDSLEANYKIRERPPGLPAVSSLSHPDQTRWYGPATLRIRVALNEESQYSFLLTKDPLLQPDEIPDKPAGTLEWYGDMEYARLEDGIYYFHIKECRGLGACHWGSKSTFRVMIDGAKPDEFQPQIRETGGVRHLVFAARDGLSGIDHYEVAETPLKIFFGVAWGKQAAPEVWEQAESPFVLLDQTLKSVVAVKAQDKAGNARIIEIAPEVVYLQDIWPAVLLIFLVIAGAVGWILTSHKAAKP